MTARRDIEFDAEGVTLRGWFYAAAIYNAGFNSSSRFYSTSTKTLGMKPAAAIVLPEPSGHVPPPPGASSHAYVQGATVTAVVDGNLPQDSIDQLALMVRLAEFDGEAHRQRKRLFMALMTPVMLVGERPGSAPERGQYHTALSRVISIFG